MSRFFMPTTTYHTNGTGCLDVTGCLRPVGSSLWRTKGLYRAVMTALVSLSLSTASIGYAQSQSPTMRDSVGSSPPLVNNATARGLKFEKEDVKKTRSATLAGPDGYQEPERDEKKDKEKEKEGEEEAVKGTTVNGQQLYKQTIDGKEYQYYYSTGEKGSQFISQMQDGSFKQTTMDAMLGRGGENGMRPIGSIETTNGKLATMYSIDGFPGSKAFFDGESWHIQGQGADSFTVSKGPNIPSEYGEYTGSFDAGKAPLENLPEGWSRGTSSGSEVFRGGSPLEGVTMGGPGGAPYTVESAMQSFDGSPPTIGEIAGPKNIQAMEKHLSSLSSAELQNFMKSANELAVKDYNGCIGCAMQRLRPGAE